MKKRFFIVALLCLLLASCGGDKDKTDETVPGTSAEVTTEAVTGESTEVTDETEETTDVTTELPDLPESEKWIGNGGKVLGMVYHTYADDGRTLRKSEWYNTDEVLCREVDHDDLGRMKTDTEYLKSGAEGNVKKYFYSGDSTAPSRFELYAEGVLRSKEFYDADGNPTLAEWYSETGGRFAYTEWTYDDRGNNTYTEHRDSDNDYNDWTEEREFNGDDVCIRLVSFRHGHKNVYEYNDEGKITGSYLYGLNGTLESHTVTSYHSTGNVHEVIHYKGDEQIRYSRYDKNGDIAEKREVQSDGRIDHTVYDGDSETTTTMYSDGKTRVVVKKDGKSIEFTSYNSDGEETYRTEREYDDRGRETKSTSYDKGVLCSIEEWEYGAEEGEYIRYTENYDADGKATSYSKCEYKKKKMVCDTYYDADRNVLKVYEYDSDGKCKTFTEYGKENIIVWQYQSGKVVTVSEYDTDENLLATDEYDLNGCRTKRTQYNADKTKDVYVYSRDNSDGDRVIKVIRYNAKGTETLVRDYVSDGTVVEWEYKNGRKAVCSRFDVHGGLYFREEYDAEGRKKVSTQFNSDGTKDVYIYDPTGSQGEYQYNNSRVAEYFKRDASGKEFIHRVYAGPHDTINVPTGTVIKEEIHEYYEDETVRRVFELVKEKSRVMQNEYVYSDKLGGLIEEKHFFTDGEFLTWAKYEHGSTWMKETFYTGDGEVESWNIREFETKNGNRLIMKHSYYGADGSLLSYVEYKYDKNGNEAQSWHHREDGCLEVRESVYGHVFRKAIYDSEGQMIVRSEIEYDEEWNMVTVTQYSDSGRWYVYTYEDGEVVDITVYNADGRVETGDGD